MKVFASWCDRFSEPLSVRPARPLPGQGAAAEVPVQFCGRSARARLEEGWIGRNFPAVILEYTCKAEEVQAGVQAERGVEWDLVDYGAGKFHVASYQATAASDGLSEDAAASQMIASAKGADSVRTPDCFFYRCWSALWDGCGRAV